MFQRILCKIVYSSLIQKYLLQEYLLIVTGKDLLQSNCLNIRLHI